MICDYLLTDPKLMGDEKRLSSILSWEPGSPTLQQYVENMRRDHTWGGAIEIKAFCDMFQAVVNVHILPTREIIEFQPAQKRGELFRFRISWNGSHYEPLLH